MNKMLIICKEQLTKFSAILFDACSLMMIPCGLKLVGVLSVILY
jgi:hypothetical protein